MNDNVFCVNIKSQKTSVYFFDLETKMILLYQSFRQKLQA